MSEATLVEILQRSLDAAGMHDADPRELPDRIAELRFGGSTFFVSPEPYPRGRAQAIAETAPPELKRRAPSPKTNSDSLVEQQGESRRGGSGRPRKIAGV